MIDMHLYYRQDVFRSSVYLFAMRDRVSNSLKEIEKLEKGLPASIDSECALDILKKSLQNQKRLLDDFIVKLWKIALANEEKTKNRRDKDGLLCLWPSCY
jgi:hypothetical protein